MEASGTTLKREPIVLNQKLPIVQNTSAKLGEVLSGLNIKPFTKESVEKYKKEKVLELEAKNRVGFFAGYLVLWVAVFACTVLAVALVWTNADPSFFGGALGIFGGFAGLLLVARVSDACNGEENSWGWERLSFRAYGESIPASVAGEMRRVREELPDAEFEVEYLVRMKDRKVFDPFLVVKYAECEYYIEVWGEQSFDGKTLT